MEGRDDGLVHRTPNKKPAGAKGFHIANVMGLELMSGVPPELNDVLQCIMIW